MFETIMTIFQEQGWPYDAHPEQNSVRFPFAGKNGNFIALVVAIPTKSQVLAYTIWPERISEQQRLATMQFITFANYNIAIGNFELDLSDGELRYKTSLDVTGDRLSAALLERLITLSTHTMDTYAPDLTAVLTQETPSHPS